MKKKYAMIKIISLLLSLALIISFSPSIQCFADTADYEDDTSCGENLTWTFSNGKLTISGTGEMKSFAGLPPWHSTVTESGVNKVECVIENGVTSIGENAFAYLNNLISVTIPESVTQIGSDAFAFCYNLTTITIPDSVESIGEYAFLDCRNLTSAYIPSSVKTIGDDVFGGCDNLTIYGRTGSYIHNYAKNNYINFVAEESYKVTFPENVTVTCNGMALNNGDSVYEDDELKIFVDIPSGYTLKSFILNGKAIYNGEVYTVGKEDVVIKAEFAELPTVNNYIITFPENVIVTRNGKTLYSGNSVSEGDALLITAEIPDGYSLISLTANGKSINSGGTYMVGEENVVIKVEFEEIPTINNYTITLPGNVTVTRNGKALYSGNTVSEGDVLLIIADIPVGYSLKLLTVNGKTINSGSVYTVGNEDVLIKVEFEEIPVVNYVVTFPESVTVTHNGKNLYSGDTVSTGDILLINADIPDGYSLKSMTINGKTVNSGSAYTVGEENIVIDVEFEEIPVATNYIVTFPANVTVTRNGNALYSGNTVSEGDMLLITANIPNGYSLKTLTVNGNNINSGNTYMVGKENVVIKVEFEAIPVVNDYIVTFPECVTVTRNGKTLSSGDIVFKGDILIITVVESDGYTLKSLTVNGRGISSGEPYTVDEENVIIRAEFNEIPVVDDLKVTFSDNIIVKRNGKALENGSVILKGDTLLITANIPAGYSLKTLTVNGVKFTNGGVYTVGEENVVIKAEFEEIHVSNDFLVIFPKNVTVKRSGIALSSGATVSKGDLLLITANVPSGYSLISLTVNNNQINNGGIYIVGEENVVINAEFDEIDTNENVTVIFPDYVIVTRSGRVLNSGDAVSENDVLRIYVSIPTGYSLKQLKVNGNTISNDSFFIVENNDVIITVEFAYISDDNSDNSQNDWTATIIPPSDDSDDSAHDSEDEEMFDEEEEDYESEETDDIYEKIEESENVTISLDNDLEDLSTGKVNINTKKSFFETSAVIHLSNTDEANNAALFALEELGESNAVFYAFDISICDEYYNDISYMFSGGYITFKIPIPENMIDMVDEISVYHIENGYPEYVESEISFDGGYMKVEFSAIEFSPYMFIVEGSVAKPDVLDSDNYEDNDMFTDKNEIQIIGGNANPNTNVKTAIIIPTAVVGCILLLKKPKRKRHKW